MRRWKSSFFFVLLTAGFCWILFTSLSPQKYSYTVTGQVEALEGSIANVKIKYSQTEGDVDFKHMKSFDVRANGTFSSVINLESQGKVYFYATKIGYTTVRHEEMLDDQNGPNDIGTLNVSSLHEQLSVKQRRDPEAGPFIYLHHDPTLSDLDDKVNVSDIWYFTDVEKVSEPGASSNLVTLSAKVNYQGQKSNRPAYFPLQRYSNGEAFVVNSAAEVPAAVEVKLASRRNKD